MSLENILQDADHPLYTLNTAYQAYVQKAQRAARHPGNRAAQEACMAYYTRTKMSQ